MKNSGSRLIIPEVIQTSAMDCGPAALKCLRFGGRLGAPNRAETLAMMAMHWPSSEQEKA